MLDDCDSPIGFHSYYSTPLDMATTIVWGDIAIPFAHETTSQQPDFRDISGIVAAFVDNDPQAPSVPVADLHPASPNGVVDFNDIAACVAAFVGDPYAFDGPTVCP